MANKTIKGILTQAALCAINHCPPVAHYYARLIERGKKDNGGPEQCKKQAGQNCDGTGQNQTKIHPRI
ncbi:MAG: hypothetical protein L6U16_05820 [Porphyromonadaceae bacterium]|nr:MAG: hypothetical protein L6U16_05820 [Porphyromonadaceae bacterium]